jgi:hypothetical protein
MWHAWERRGKCTRFWRQNPRKRSLLRLGHRWEDRIRMRQGDWLEGAWVE